MSLSEPLSVIISIRITLLIPNLIHNRTKQQIYEIGKKKEGEKKYYLNLKMIFPFYGFIKYIK